MFVEATESEHAAFSVLDLKSEYPSLQNNVLLPVLEEKIPSKLETIMAPLLERDWTSTVGDEKRTRIELEVGISK